MHQNKNQNNDQSLHVPVLLAEVLNYLQPKLGESYLDLTAGYGGHAAAVLVSTEAPTRATLVDRDSNAIAALTPQFAPIGVTIMQQDFLSASQELAHAGKQFDLILADLGVSSPHLNQTDRGFAFAEPGPIDMRMDQTQVLTAADIVNTYSEDKLADILTRYGEEPKARHIAKLIVGNRPFTTTTELAAVVAKAWPGHSRVHPATRTFQALRIAVNDELNLIEQSLPLWFDLLAPGGRLVVISFHSLEDRLVKQALSAEGGDDYEASLRILTRRPITASHTELVTNPRARSAKLRAAVKK